MKTICSLLFLTLSCAALADEGKAIYTSVCATCHGKAGEGNVELKTPSIASLPSWYTLSQIEKITRDVRSVASNDVHLLAMREIVKTLTPEKLNATAAYVRSLTRHPTRNTLGGDPERGKVLYAHFCMECHRYNASGERVFKSAPLTGLQDWYMAAQFKKYRELARGPRQDTYGHKMHIVATRMKDDSDLHDILAYISELADEAAKALK